MINALFGLCEMGLAFKRAEFVRTAVKSASNYGKVYFMGNTLPSQGKTISKH